MSYLKAKVCREPIAIDKPALSWDAFWGFYFHKNDSQHPDTTSLELHEARVTNCKSVIFQIRKVRLRRSKDCPKIDAKQVKEQDFMEA